MIHNTKYNFRIPGMIILISFLVFSFSIPAITQPYLDWERFNIAPNNGESFPVDLKIDSNEFVYNLCSDGGFSVFKYDKMGNLIWNTRYFHPGIRLNTKPHSMTVDNLGNVYCVGDNGDEVVTIKIDSAGVLQWVRSYIPGLGFYSAGGIALDPENNIVVIGGSPSNDARIIYGAIKYSPAGDTVWNKVGLGNFPLERGGIPKDIKISSNGEIYISGILNITIPNGSESRCIVIKLSNDGNLLWIDRYNLPKSGLLYTFLDENEEYVFTVGGVTDDGLSDVIILKYDTSGNMIWDVRYDTPEGYSEELRDAIIDSDNNIIFTARSGTFLGKIPFILTCKYDTSGNLVWENRFQEEGSHTNYPMGLHHDIENNIYVTGDAAFLGNIYFSNLIKYNENGDYIWNVLNGTPNRKNTGHKVIKSDEKLYVLGTMLWTNGMFNSILIKYSENPLSVNSNYENLNFKLFQNYPNPFNPTTTIKFDINKKSKVELRVFDVLGRELNVILSEQKETGSHVVVFDGKDLPSGIYYYSLIVNNESVSTKKMILTK